jgi:hypothetical protein
MMKGQENLPSSFVRINIGSGLLGGEAKEERIKARPTRPKHGEPCFPYLEYGL